MPSFDAVSELDSHELTNAVDQANRELTQRFDFKDTGAVFELAEKEMTVTMKAPAEFQLRQMLDVLIVKLAKRSVDLRSLEKGDLEKAGGDKVRQTVTVRTGVDPELAKKLVRLIKDAKLKVQASIQGEAVRVSGAKRDTLQEAIALVRKSITDFPLQYINFRD